MRQKTGFGCRNPVDLVSKYIGTSYDVVKLVADNIDMLESISINIDGILEIGDNIDDISIVADNIEEVVLVGQNIDNLEEVILHIDDISLINDNITDVVTVADNIDHIIFLAESISNPTLIDRVDDLESRVDILEDTSSTHTNQINLQSGYIQDLQTNVNSNSTEIDSLDIRITDVETLSQNNSDTLANHIVDYNANKSSVDTKFIEVENDIQANTDAIAAWEEYDDTALSGRVTILEDDLDSLTIEVANNKDAIDNFENYDDTELRGRVETNELDITNLEDVVNNLDGLSPADRTKFDGIEDGATADQTGAEIKAAYEAEADTNAYTDADKVLVDGAIQTLIAGSNIVISGFNDKELYISAIPAASIGLTNHVYITGDTETTTEGTFYTTSNIDKGTVPEVVLSATVNDGESAVLPSEFLSIIYPDDAVLPAGTYEGNLSVNSSNGNAQLSILQELYLTDPEGVLIDSGLDYVEVGSLGVRPIVNLFSGTFELSADDISNVPVGGILREQVDALANNRVRYHTIITKENNSGGDVNVDIYIGSEYNSYLNSISPIGTDNLVNDSEIFGSTTTDALNVLNDSKIDEAPLDGAQYVRQSGLWVESESAVVAPVGDIKIVGKDEVVPGYDSLEETWYGDLSTDPILHGIYYTRGGNYTKTEMSTRNYASEVAKIYEYDTAEEGSLYVDQTNDYYLRIFKDYENRTDEAVININPVDHGATSIGILDLTKLTSVHNGLITFFHTSYDDIVVFEMDYSLPTTQEIADSATIRVINTVTEFGLGVTTVRPTGSGLLLWMDPWNTYQCKRIPWDLNLANTEDIDLSNVNRISDGPAEKEFLFNNDFILSRGTLYDYAGNNVITIDSYDHASRKSHLYSKGIDYIQNYTTSTTKNIYVGYEDGSYEVKEFSTSSNNATSNTVVMYYDENNWMTYSSYYSYRYMYAINKDGVLTEVPDDQVLKSTSSLSAVALYQFNRPELLVQDENDLNTNYKYEYLTEVPDNFQIEAIASPSEDKKYVIKTESAMLRDGVE